MILKRNERYSMLKKLSRYGNSMALILDKPILELLNIKENTELKITTDGKAIIITPVNSQEHQHKVCKSFTTITDVYQDALKKLAGN